MITAEAICEMSYKTIDSKPDRFPADDHTPRSQQAFNIRRTQRKAMVHPNGSVAKFFDD